MRFFRWYRKLITIFLSAYHVKLDACCSNHRWVCMSTWWVLATRWMQDTIGQVLQAACILATEKRMKYQKLMNYLALCGIEYESQLFRMLYCMLQNGILQHAVLKCNALYIIIWHATDLWYGITERHHSSTANVGLAHTHPINEDAKTSRMNPMQLPECYSICGHNHRSFPWKAIWMFEVKPVFQFADKRATQTQNVTEAVRVTSK